MSDRFRAVAVASLLATVVLASGGTASAGPPVASHTCGDHHVSSDFNGDGRPDLAIGSPGATVSDDIDAGAVTEFVGTPAGPKPRRLWTPASAGVPGRPGVSHNFGEALATGDFNGDGCADLASVAVGADDSVTVLPGSPRGLVSTGSARIFAGDINNAGGCSPTLCPQFGSIVAAGDVNGDGYDDLAIVENAAYVVILRGSATGLESTDAWELDSASGGTIDNRVRVDGIAAGDIDGDGLADLAIGWGEPQSNDDDDARPAARRTPPTPADDQSSLRSGVGIVFGSPGGPGGGRATQLWSRATPGSPRFCSAPVCVRAHYVAALGDFDHNGHADLAFTQQPVPYDDESYSAGPYHSSHVTVLYGGPHGLSTTHAQEWSKRSKDVVGATVAGDRWGASLTSGDLDGDGAADLVIGDTKTQQVSVLYGSMHHRLTPTGNQLWSQSTRGLAGKRVHGDDWSSGISALQLGRGNPTDLVVADPDRDDSRGIVTELFGTRKHGLVAKHSRQVGRDSPGVPGSAQGLDNFGLGLIGKTA